MSIEWVVRIISPALGDVSVAEHVVLLVFFGQSTVQQSQGQTRKWCVYTDISLYMAEILLHTQSRTLNVQLPSAR